jgi:methylated-DNA-[protein]-cysteine S-methyltransferase
MTPTTTRTLSSPIGPITLAAEDGRLVSLAITPGREPSREAVEEPVLSRAEAWLEAYFAGRVDHDPGPPPQLEGTDFQQRVWRALQAIPFGRTRTYGEIARELGSAPRAVGGACRANPCVILVPCHRVVAADGPGGFAGRTRGPWFAIKEQLLGHERRRVRQRA